MTFGKRISAIDQPEIFSNHNFSTSYLRHVISKRTCWKQLVSSHVTCFWIATIKRTLRLLGGSGVLVRCWDEIAGSQKPNGNGSWMSTQWKLASVCELCELTLISQKLSEEFGWQRIPLTPWAAKTRSCFEAIRHPIDGELVKTATWLHFRGDVNDNQ